VAGNRQHTQNAVSKVPDFRKFYGSFSVKQCNSVRQIFDRHIATSISKFQEVVRCQFLWTTFRFIPTLLFCTSYSFWSIILSGAVTAPHDPWLLLVEADVLPTNSQARE